MKMIYNAVTAVLKNGVPGLNWIDLDRGQIDRIDQSPSIDYPCVLIDMGLSDCESIYQHSQQCTASVVLRIVQNPNAVESGVIPPIAQAQDRSLQCYDLIEQIYQSLQGLEIGNLSPLSRFEQNREIRPDGLFVYRIEFLTRLDDLASDQV